MGPPKFKGKPIPRLHRAFIRALHRQGRDAKYISEYLSCGEKSVQRHIQNATGDNLDSDDDYYYGRVGELVNVDDLPTQDPAEGSTNVSPAQVGPSIKAERAQAAVLDISDDSDEDASGTYQHDPRSAVKLSVHKSARMRAIHTKAHKRRHARKSARLQGLQAPYIRTSLSPDVALRASKRNRKSAPQMQRSASFSSSSSSSSSALSDLPDSTPHRFSLPRRSSLPSPAPVPQPPALPVITPRVVPGTNPGTSSLRAEKRPLATFEVSNTTAPGRIQGSTLSGSGVNPLLVPQNHSGSVQKSTEQTSSSVSAHPPIPRPRIPLFQRNRQSGNSVNHTSSFPATHTRPVNGTPDIPVFLSNVGRSMTHCAPAFATLGIRTATHLETLAFMQDIVLEELAQKLRSYGLSVLESILIRNGLANIHANILARATEPSGGTPEGDRSSSAASSSRAGGSRTVSGFLSSLRPSLVQHAPVFYELGIRTTDQLDTLFHLNIEGYNMLDRELAAKGLTYMERLMIKDACRPTGQRS